MKRESQTEELATSEKVQITDLTFTHLTGGGVSAVQINLTVQYSDAFSGPSTPVTLSQTASLRGAY